MMKISWKPASFVVLAAALMAAGCASTDDVKRAQSTADQALSAANAASQKADAVNGRVDELNDKVDKMFAKGLKK